MLGDNIGDKEILDDDDLRRIARKKKRLALAKFDKGFKSSSEEESSDEYGNEEGEAEQDEGQFEKDDDSDVSGVIENYSDEFEEGEEDEEGEYDMEDMMEEGEHDMHDMMEYGEEEMSDMEEGEQSMDEQDSDSEPPALVPIAAKKVAPALLGKKRQEPEKGRPAMGRGHSEDESDEKES